MCCAKCVAARVYLTPSARETNICTKWPSYLTCLSLSQDHTSKSCLEPAWSLELEDRDNQLFTLRVRILFTRAFKKIWKHGGIPSLFWHGLGTAYVLTFNIQLFAVWIPCLRLRVEQWPPRPIGNAFWVQFMWIGVLGVAQCTFAFWDQNRLPTACLQSWNNDHNQN